MYNPVGWILCQKGPFLSKSDRSGKPYNVYLFVPVSRERPARRVDQPPQFRGVIDHVPRRCRQRWEVVVPGETGREERALQA